MQKPGGKGLLAGSKGGGEVSSVLGDSHEVPTEKFRNALSVAVCAMGKERIIIYGLGRRLHCWSSKLPPILSGIHRTSSTALDKQSGTDYSNG